MAKARVFAASGDARPMMATDPLRNVEATSGSCLRRATPQNRRVQNCAIQPDIRPPPVAHPQCRCSRPQAPSPADQQSRGRASGPLG